MIISLHGIINKIVNTASSLLTGLFASWNGETTGVSLDSSIYRVYNGDSINDTSGNAQNGINNGSVTFTTGKAGNAFTFNGSNYISLPDNSLNITTDFSFSFWWFRRDVNDQALFSNMQKIGSNYYGWYIYFNSGNMDFYVANGTPSMTYWRFIPSGSSDNWYHITLVKPLSTSPSIYLNGFKNNFPLQTGSATNNPVYSATQKCAIGNVWYGFYDSYIKNTSKIDSLNVWNKALTANEVLSLYNNGTGIEYPFSSLTLPSLNDSVSLNHGTQTTLGSMPTFTTGKIGKAFQFDGINDYISLPNNSMNFISSSFSVSFWVYLSNITSGNYALVSNYANDGVHRGWIVGSMTNGKLYFGIYQPALQETSTSATISINTWYHVTCVYTPNQPTKTYINGSLDSTSSTAYNPSYATTHYPCIGASKYNASSVQQYMPNGSKIDAVTVWNKTLTQTEITELYNSGNGIQLP